MAWAEGLASELSMTLPSEQDYRFRISAFPYRSKGPACQGVKVRVNGPIVAFYMLEATPKS